MSSRMRRSTSKVAASSPLTSWGAVVAMGICRILAMFSDSEIGFADVGLLQEVAGQALGHDAALLQYVGPIGNVERLQDVLLDQQHCRAVSPHARDDIEHVVDDGRRQAERRLVE